MGNLNVFQNERKEKKGRYYVKYRMMLIIEKDDSKDEPEIVHEYSLTYDDFKTANRLFVWLVGCIHQFKRENDYDETKQRNLFNGKKK